MSEFKKNKYEYTDWENFGKRVRENRKSLGLTVEKLADIIDRSENFINRIEKGEKSCSIHTIHQLSKSLRVPIDTLLYGEVVKEKEYTNREKVQAMIDRCNDMELEVVVEIILAVFPKFEYILEEKK